MEVVILTPPALGLCRLAIMDRRKPLFPGRRTSLVVDVGRSGHRDAAEFSTPLGAKLLRLATLGLMQYIAPSLIFLISFTVFGEELDFWQGVTFVMIWCALVLYSTSLLRQK